MLLLLWQQSFHRLIMGKVKVGLYFYLTADSLTKVLQKCALSNSLPNIWILSKLLNLIGCHGNRKAKFVNKFSKFISSEAIRLGVKLKICRNVDNINLYKSDISCSYGERGGSVVECRTPEREVRGSRPTAAVLCPWARHFTPRKYWLITQEAMAPSRYDWKIVDWDVKPQHNQPIIVHIALVLSLPLMYNEKSEN